MLQDVSYRIHVGIKTKAFPTVYESVAEPVKRAFSYLLQGRGGGGGGGGEERGGRRGRDTTVVALDRVSSVLEPHQIHLVLGGPKSGQSTHPPTHPANPPTHPPTHPSTHQGKTSLLKAISGRIRPSSSSSSSSSCRRKRRKQMSGAVTYNGTPATHQAPFDMTSLACFVEAADVHEAFLTVRVGPLPTHPPTHPPAHFLPSQPPPPPPPFSLQ